MRNRVLIILAVLGLAIGLASAFIYSRQKKAEPPAFQPASNPYRKGIYANGIVESYQENGQNINIYPEVSGTIVKIPVGEGQSVAAGEPLLMLDDSVQRATTAQLGSQALAARTQLEQLKAQPRKEALEVAVAQVEVNTAALKMAQDQWNRLRRLAETEPRSISKDVLENAENAEKVARANLDVAKRQYNLVRAGAWNFEIRNQENQLAAAVKACQAAEALLAKYTVRAPSAGVVLSINAAPGSYVSPQGAYDSYTQGTVPVLVMGGTQQRFLGVRCYIDEILVQRLPPGNQMNSRMFIRGTDLSIPLEFVRVQPYVSPKIDLSNQRTERVDVRVLPVIFRFQKPQKITLYPGQLVDVYIGEK
ncbi:HlyD family secretion protein [Geomonas sp.]|uniref:HlyD family secretion protein n=1 Tax=Geomonas sp. TaxID=2651584 RepID=UPI002B45DEDF|nr:biotin/lipoyl-binding protein [Geomonas sp.]HJV33524.1 biotin/lipoyl-binding protein [Geomonas sp.]